MTAAPRQLAALLMLVFAVHVVAVPAHVAHEHAGFGEVPHQDHGGDPHEHEHGHDEIPHSAGDHDVAMRGLERGETLVVIALAAFPDAVRAPWPALAPTACLVRPEPFEPRGTGPPRAHGARAPPLA